MDYSGKISIAGGFIVAVGVLLIVVGLNTKSIETSLDESVEVAIGYSIGRTEELIGVSDFSFTDIGKVSKKILKYQSNAMETFIDDVQIIDVPFIDQTILYPTGCESVSTTTVLQYYGIDITVDEFIERHLAKANLEIIGYEHGDAILSSEHPNDAFIGNPKSAYGLGCYEGTIVNAINSVLEDRELKEYFKVTSHLGLTFEDIKSYLDRDVPVIVWATQNMVQSEKGMSWYIEGTDTIFQYTKNEHCLVAIGYDSNDVYFNDSLVGRIAYPKDLFLDRYAQMGSRAVTIEYVGG